MRKVFFIHALLFAMLEAQLPTFDLEGHRGCRGLMPENTVAAFLKAIDLGVTTLEMDLVVSKDHQVVVSHEAYFNDEITTLPSGEYLKLQNEKKYNIYQMPYAEIKKFDVGLKPHPRFLQQQKIKAYKPTLGEVIDSVETYLSRKNPQQKPTIFYNIETKSTAQTDNIDHPTPAIFVELIMQIVKAKGIEKRVILQSFDIRTLQYAHEHYPDIFTAYLYEEEAVKGPSLEERLENLGFLPTIYSPEYTLVTPELVAFCKSKDLKLITWTVNDLQTMRKLKKMGVDGLITDYPNLYTQL